MLIVAVPVFQGPISLTLKRCSNARYSLPGMTFPCLINPLRPEGGPIDE